MSRGRAVLVASLVLVLSAGCSRTQSSPQPEALSAWDQTLAEIGEDGKVSLATALKAFALAIAPLPGVQVPASKVDIFSGTIAINWVIAHWAELTTPQQSAVENALSGKVPPRGRAPYAGFGELPVRSAPTGPNVDCLAADVGDAAPFRAMIGPILADIATHLGPAVFANPDTNRRSEDFQLHVAVDTEQRVAARMYSIPCTGGVAAAVTDDPTSCSIHVTPEALKPEHSTNDRRAILIHELMHCVMHARLGAAYIDGAPWYWEGVPTWAMTVLGGGDTGSAKHWRDYLNTPGRSLYQRSYDALGFYVHLAETGTDVWSRIDPIGRSFKGGNQAAWAAAQPSASFMDSWGPGYVTGRYPGKPWDTDGPGLPRHQPNIFMAPVANGTSVSVDAPVAGVGIGLIDVSAEVLTLLPSAAAKGRFATGLGHDMSLAEAAGTVFCAKPGGCSCPENSEGAGTQFTQLTGGPNYVGVTGGPEAAAVGVVGVSLDDFCRKKRTACVLGTWTGVGYDLAVEGMTQHGGAGVRLVVDKTGQMTVTYDGMAPVVFEWSADGALYAGSYVYSGSVSGRVKLPPAGATSGTWEPVGSDGGTILATLTFTTPVELTVGPVNLADLAGAAAGVAGPQPIGPGGWTCSGDRMVITPSQGTGISGTWTLQRTG